MNQIFTIALNRASAIRSSTQSTGSLDAGKRFNASITAAGSSLLESGPRGLAGPPNKGLP